MPFNNSNNANNKKNNGQNKQNNQNNQNGNKNNGGKYFKRKKQPVMHEKTKKILSKFKVIPLGGLGEIGKNMTVVEYENQMIVIDCGIGFPDDSMPGVDLVIPDTTYLEENRDKLLGFVLTHGHEDHIGALPYVLRMVNAPVYGTLLTLGIVESKLEEHGLVKSASLHQVNAGDKIKLGCFTVEFIHVNHSIADACAIAVTTEAGTLVFSGDFKIDLTPIQGEPMDLARFGELGKEGVLALFMESTNSERAGYTMSERTVGRSLKEIFLSNADKRIIIATFSSNVHRVQQIIDYSHKCGRKVVLSGRSMVTIINAAVKYGYMDIPEGTLIDINDTKRFKPSEITIVTTGTQGEPMSALSRMAFSEHDKVTLGEDDLVVISASTIPGNEKDVTKITNELLKKGVTLLNDEVADVHVSGHACAEELKLLIHMTKPKYFVPMHGEYRHLKKNCSLAQEMGVDAQNMCIAEIGECIEIGEDVFRVIEKVPSGKVLIDGLGVGDVGSVVLRERRHLAEDGIIMVICGVDFDVFQVISGPEIVSRGFVYVKDSEELMDGLRQKAEEVLERCMDEEIREYNVIKGKIKDVLTNYIYSMTKRKPMIVPMIMEV